MPGKRNFAREAAQHALDAPQKQADLYWMLRQQLPTWDRALVGYPAIISHLHGFGLRRLNGGPLTERIVRAWRSRGFPIVNGRWRSCTKQAALTSSHAVTAWLLTRPVDTGELFKVVMPQALTTAGSFQTPRKSKDIAAA